MDAHPNVVIAHDYFLFRQLKLKRNKGPTVNLSQLYSQLFYWSTVNDDFRNLEKGYSFNIDGSWQGRFTELKVIGDKSGRSAVVEYIKDRDQQLAATVNVPIKVLQVVRNPLDMIATKVLFTGSPTKTTKVNATVEHKYRNFGLINKAATHFVNFTKEIIGMIYDVGLSPLTHIIYHSDYLFCEVDEMSSSLIYQPKISVFMLDGSIYFCSLGR